MAASGFSLPTTGGVSHRAGLSGRSDQFPKPPAVDPRIVKVTALMRRVMHRKLLLPELAHASGLSVSHLCHLFKTYTGVGPRKYLKSLRMERAKELLENSLLRVKEIGARLGYDDPSRFVEDFRKTYGLPPLRYRDRVSQANFAGYPVTADRSDPATGTY
jgi:transcriptional regulator GlxA family with amidase domain